MDVLEHLDTMDHRRRVHSNLAPNGLNYNGILNSNARKVAIQGSQLQLPYEQRGEYIPPHLVHRQNL